MIGNTRHDIPPMLCQSAKPFDSKDWVFELKLDGTRGVSYIEKNSVRIINRRRRNIIERYPELQNLPGLVNAKDCVLDGEIVVFDKKGKPNFYELATREQTSNKTRIEILSKTMPATYVVFDILRKDGKDLTGLPLLERKRILRQTLNESDYVLIIDSIDGKGKALFRKVMKLKLEGVIAKKKDSVYEPGVRSDKWLKIKALKTVDAVVIGYTAGHGARENTFGALVLGIFKEEKLFHIGRVGTGWSAKDLLEIKPTLDKYVTGVCPVKDTMENWSSYGAKYMVRWLKPELVAEVEYLEFTKRMDLRAPSFKHLRFDKPAKECTIDQVL